jgi:hypothetical protein
LDFENFWAETTSEGPAALNGTVLADALCTFTEKKNKTGFVMGQGRLKWPTVKEKLKGHFCLLTFPCSPSIAQKVDKIPKDPSCILVLCKCVLQKQENMQVLSRWSQKSDPEKPNKEIPHLELNKFFQTNWIMDVIVLNFHAVSNHLGCKLLIEKKITQMLRRLNDNSAVEKDLKSADWPMLPHYFEVKDGMPVNLGSVFKRFYKLSDTDAGLNFRATTKLGNKFRFAITQLIFEDGFNAIVKWGLNPSFEPGGEPHTLQSNKFLALYLK